MGCRIYQLLAPVLVWLLATSAYGQPLMDIVVNGNFQEELAGWIAVEAEGSTVQYKQKQGVPLIVADVQKFSTTKPWSVALRQNLRHGFSAGQSITILAKMRSPSKSKLNLYLEDSKDPTLKFVSKEDCTLTDTWQDVAVTGTPSKDIPPGAARLSFNLGIEDGTFEIAMVRIIATGAIIPESLRPPAPVKPAPPADPTPAPPAPPTPGTPTQPAISSLPNVISNPQFKDMATGWKFNAGNIAKLEIYKTDGPKGLPFVHAEVVAVPKMKSWDVNVLQPLNEMANAGQDVYLSFQARSPDNLPIYAYVESNNSRRDRYLSRRVNLTPEWQTYITKGQISTGVGKGDLQLIFFLANGSGTIEFTDVHVAITKPLNLPGK